ncbi:OmpA family protein [uncultured Chitinophaga sp.]|mgnify:CR=1 FL=1|jgi:Outer membrane protein and related peptidoglycan-associated (lipo)proteins|uniref:OmpA family protein n=1 Tax=uncultured Chitinophaga sp. TaxID=339340 RepID=UPI002633A9F5|nr:OmpA family protein [uncultured Chitinophaga sp.]
MSFDLLNTIKGLFTGDVISQAAARLGESEQGVQKAVNSIIPTILTGLLHKAGPQGDADGALNIARDAVGANATTAIISSLQSGSDSWVSRGMEWLQSLFGSKVSTVVGAVATYAGIKAASANALLNAATPAALGVTGEYAAEENLSGPGFLAYLNSQKDNILGAVPSGFNLAGLLGLGSLSELGKRLSGATGGLSARTADIGETATRTAGNRWIWSLLLILVAIILLWYLARGCGGGSTTESVSDTVATDNLIDTAIAQVATPAPSRESVQVTLPDGVTLNAYKGGIEDQLVAFLKDDSRQAGKDVWFDFDNLNFKTGSAELTEDSRQQVQHIAAILKAFPTSRIKIGGYTDRSGDSLANKQLSQARADTVLASLKNLGTASRQLEGAEGYGSQFAKADATAPDEERRKDRRISVSVRKK